MALNVSLIEKFLVNELYIAYCNIKDYAEEQKAFCTKMDKQFEAIKGMQDMLADEKKRVQKSAK